jgi:hypothetical protein
MDRSFNTLTKNSSTMDFTRMANDKSMEFFPIQSFTIKETFPWAKNRAKAKLSLKMEIFTKDNSGTIILKVKAYTHGPMERTMTGIFVKV